LMVINTTFNNNITTTNELWVHINLWKSWPIGKAG
jgi:hypothetical protein